MNVSTGPLKARPAKLSDNPIIESGTTQTLNCNADLVGLPQEKTTIVELKILRKLNGKSRKELVAHYNPYSLIWKRPSMTYVSCNA